MRSMRPIVYAVLTGTLSLIIGQGALAQDRCETTQPWINEVDYDDDAGFPNYDRGEFVEIAAPSGTDLTGYRVVVIEGSTDGWCWSGFGSAGNAYIDATLLGSTMTVLDQTGNNIGMVSVCFTSTSPSAANCDIVVSGVANDSNLKNGSLTQPAGNCADGVLLVDPGGSVVDAVGWEGQVANTGAWGQYFQAPFTPYYLYPPTFDDGYGMNESVYKQTDNAGRALARAEWAKSAVGGATPGQPNLGQTSLGCTFGPVCGDGLLEAPEECDDGNLADDDGCNSVCVQEICGDGILQAGIGEQCDDGNVVGGDGCDALCEIEAPLCGDGNIDPGEECDDSNLIDGDGCSTICLVEFCGDGTTQAGLGEACDDGNATAGDGCSDLCAVEFCGDGVTQVGIGELCDDGNAMSGDGCNSICQPEACGDGIVQAGIGEECDDGNLANLDGCSDVCIVEIGVCGNGIDEFDEDCDDGNPISGDGCSSICEVEPTGVCGDGVVHPTEGCDDGNLVTGDGCSAGCVDEPSGACGDGVLHPSEECDDANVADEDGCSMSCLNEFCGDTVQQAGLGEECDDGNAASEDGCSAACVAESCGDGVLQAGLGEECDDGNTTNFDGCSAVCLDVPVLPSISPFGLMGLALLLIGTGLAMSLGLRSKERDSAC